MTTPPTRTKADIAHSVIKAGLSAIPMIGGPATELFQHVVQPPLDRRRQEWMNSIGEKLLQLESQGLDLAALRDNEEFISAVMQASQIALRSHQNEKLEALRAAISNVALGQSPGDAELHMMLGLVDNLSVLQIEILRVFQRPEVPPSMSMGGLSNVLEHNLPKLRGQEHLSRQLWRDLYARGLVEPEGMNTTMSESGLAQKRTTHLGDIFIQFISDRE